MSTTKTKKPAAEAVEEGKTNAATEALTDEEKQRSLWSLASELKPKNPNSTYPFSAPYRLQASLFNR